MVSRPGVRSRKPLRSDRSRRRPGVRLSGVTRRCPRHSPGTSPPPQPPPAFRPERTVHSLPGRRVDVGRHSVGCVLVCDLRRLSTLTLEHVGENAGVEVRRHRSVSVRDRFCRGVFREKGGPGGCSRRPGRTGHRFREAVQDGRVRGSGIGVSVHRSGAVSSFAGRPG
jgi:hypothetical protein